MVVSSLRKIAALALVAIGALVSTQQAKAQVSVDVNITVNGVTILYYYDTINVTFTAAALGSVLTTGCSTITNGVACVEAGGLTGSATAGGGALTLDAGTAWVDALAVSPTAVPLVLSNVWAVRAIGGASGNTGIGVALGANNVLTGSAGGTITITAASTTVPATNPFPDPGLVTPTFGNARLVLDLTGVTNDGTYSSLAGASQYVISITST